MATTRPRTTITLTEPVHAVLSRFSELTDQSMSSVILQFLEQAAPQLERITVMLQAAKDATPEAVAEVRRTLDRAEAVLQSHQGAIMTTLDLFTAPLAKSAAEVAVGAPKGEKTAARNRKQPAEAGGGSPPAPNRGGRSNKTSINQTLPESGKAAKVVRLRDRKIPS